MTKADAHKLVDYMPEKSPFNEVIEIFRKLGKEEDQQAETGKNIDWESLKKEINSWPVNR